MNKYKLGVEIKKHLMSISKTWRIKNYVAIKRRASCESTKGGEDSGNRKRPAQAGGQEGGRQKGSPWNEWEETFWLRRLQVFLRSPHQTLLFQTAASQQEIHMAECADRAPLA